MTDLAAWLNAQLDHDDQLARRATADLRGTSWQSFADELWKRTDDVDGICDHVERHDPARVLHQVEAHRRILAEHEGALQGMPDDLTLNCITCRSAWPCPTVYALATAYAADPTLTRHDDGTVKGDPIIRVTRELLDQAEPWAWDGFTLTLDAAGHHRYSQIGPDPDDDRTLLFERLSPPKSSGE